MRKQVFKLMQYLVILYRNINFNKKNIMRKNLLIHMVLYSVFLLMLASCKMERGQDEGIKTQEYSSKSFWKEDEKYIRNIIKIYYANEQKIKKVEGTPYWDYAMSMGKYDESFMVVPIVKGGRVITTLTCAKFGEKVYFRYDDVANNVEFFDHIIFGKYTKYNKLAEDSATKPSSAKGLVCVQRSVSMWYPDDENDGTAGHWVIDYYTVCYSFLDYLDPIGLDGGEGGGFDYGGGGDIGDMFLTMPPPPDIPIKDLQKFLSCFDKTKPANLTVYAEKMFNGNGVGHGFIAITQGNNTMVYGFYPKYSFGTMSGPGIMGENGGHHYDVSGNLGQITADQLSQIIALSQTYQNSYYDLNVNNCSDFATDVLNIAGVKTTGYFDTPNTLASILMTLPNHTNVSNYAPQTNRTCP